MIVPWTDLEGSGNDMLEDYGKVSTYQFERPDIVMGVMYVTSNAIPLRNGPIWMI